MATTKKTTTEKKTTTAKKAPAKKTTKPKLTVVKEEPVQEFSVFEKIAARYPITRTEVDLGDGVTVNVRNRLTLGEMLTLVHLIVDACVSEDAGEVHFELFDYTAKLMICAVYCDEVAPDNNEIGYAAVCGTNRLYDTIAGYIDQDQLETIWGSAREKLCSKRDMFNGAAAKITIDMLGKINELYEMISNVTENFDGEEAVNAVKNLSTLVGR